MVKIYEIIDHLFSLAYSSFLQLHVLTVQRISAFFTGSVQFVKDGLIAELVFLLYNPSSALYSLPLDHEAEYLFLLLGFIRLRILFCKCRLQWKLSRSWICRKSLSCQLWHEPYESRKFLNYDGLYVVFYHPKMPSSVALALICVDQLLFWEIMCSLHFRYRLVQRTILSMDLVLVLGVLTIRNGLKDPDRVVWLSCYFICFCMLELGRCLNLVLKQSLIDFF